MMSQPGYKQLQYTYCSISQEGNQTMKFGQLIEYNTKNIHILEKSCTKCGVETIPILFSKKSKLGMFLDQWSKVFTVCFDCMVS